MKSYNFNYFFSVEGRKYQGKCSFDKVPNLQLLNISYLPETPEINSNNPEKALESLKESQDSNLSLYLGYGLVIFGLFRTLASFWEIRAQKKARAAEEERQLEEDNRRIFGNG